MDTSNNKVITVFLFFLFYNIVNVTGQNTIFTPRKVVFKEFTNISEEGKIQFSMLRNKMVDTVNRRQGEDSMAQVFGGIMGEFMQLDLLKKDSTQRLNIVFENDSLWRYSTRYNQIIDNKTLLDFWQPRGYRKDSIQNASLKGIKNDSVTISVFKNDTKSILGISCYKVVIVKKEKLDADLSFLKLGDDIYEMYVSDDIHLPLYAVNYLSIDANFFPLEIIHWNAYMSGIKDVTIAQAILR